MDDVVTDSNDLLREFDSVSRSQRTLFAEFERQRSRLVQLTRWYDHQQVARDTELRRQSEQVNKQCRRQIFYRSKMTINERARLKHLLTNDDSNQLFSNNHSKSSRHLPNLVDERKRHVYGCLLPQFKAPLGQSYNQWPTKSLLYQSDYEKRLERQRKLIDKYTQPLKEQRNRMNIIMDKCLDQLVQCDSDGYDHFLRTSEPTRNAEILAQQKITQKNEN